MNIRYPYIEEGIMQVYNVFPLTFKIMSIKHQFLQGTQVKWRITNKKE